MSPSRLLAPGLALGLALALTGCGAGFRAQTYQERTQAEATNESLGEIAVRNLFVLAPEGVGSAVYEEGEDATAVVTFVNKGRDEDTLTRVTSPLAASVDVLDATGEEAELTVGGLESVDDYVLVLRGLTRQVRTGEYIEMELTFARNGTEAMLVPVKLTGEPDREAGLDAYHLDPIDSAGGVLVEEGEGHGGGGAHGGEGEAEETAGEGGLQVDEDGPSGGISSTGEAGSGDTD